MKKVWKWLFLALCTACALCAFAACKKSGAAVATHRHAFAHFIGREATCYKKGVKEHLECLICYKTFSTQTREEVTTQDLEIACVPHTEVESEEIEMTCTRNGRTAGKYCQVCHTILEGLKEVPARHKDIVTDRAVAATCTESGLTEGKHCTVCDTVTVKQEVVPATGHTEVIDRAVAATCTTDGLTEGKHCSACKTALVEQEIIPATGHKWGDKTCSVCGVDYYTEGLQYIPGGDGNFYSVSGMGTATDTEIVVPSEYDGKPVTAVANSAFKNCVSLTGIALPDGVTKIGSYAFYGCASLTGIIIPQGVQAVNNEAFRGCGSLESVTIPDSVTSIGVMAFYGCGSLLSITLDKATTIADYAFHGCGSLENVTFGNDVASVGGYAFGECRSLKSIALGNRVATIGGHAFNGCRSLTSITVGNGITSVNYGAFENCPIETAAIPAILCRYIATSALKQVTITGGETIEDSALKDCTELASLTIGSTVTDIGEKAFYHCCSLTDLFLPDSVTSIGRYAFSGCDSLKSITVDANNADFASQDGILYNKAKTQFIHIPKAITGTVTVSAAVSSIGNEFAGCCFLTEVIIPEGVTAIEMGAFYNCTGLTDITVSADLTVIDEEAFASCGSLMQITFYGTTEQWDFITKGFNWDFGTGDFVIRCTNGKLDKDGNEIQSTENS